MDFRYFCSIRTTNLYPHPEDCSQFIICSNGYGYLQSCPDQMIFNARSRICDYSTGNHCFQPTRPDPDGRYFVKEYNSHGGIFYNPLSGYRSHGRSGEMIHSVHIDVPLSQNSLSITAMYSPRSTGSNEYGADRNILHNLDHSGEYGNCIYLIVLH